MTLDRTEANGFGVAFVGHAALAAALYFLINPRPDAGRAPPPPSIEVSFVEETGIVSSGETTEAAAASFAPEAGAPEEAAPAEPEPAPVSEPVATPAPSPAPTPSPAPAQRRALPAPAPAQQRAVAQPKENRQTATGRGQANRGAALGPDLLKGIGNDPDSTSQRVQGAVMSAEALAGIVEAIKRQVLPCARRNRSPGPGASDIRVRINLRINRDGTLAGTPRALSTSGVNSENARYEDRVKELAINAFIACSPLRGLPDELYRTPSGGWNNINLNYSLP